MTNIIVKIGDQKIIIEVEGMNSWEEVSDYVFGNIEVVPACGNCGREAEDFDPIRQRCERCKTL